MTSEDFATVALASYRITRLVTTDKLTARPRRDVMAWAMTRRHEGYQSWKIDDLVSCSFCAGWWITLLVLAAWRVRLLRPVVRAFAVAGAQSLLNAADAAMTDPR